MDNLGLLLNWRSRMDSLELTDEQTRNHILSLLPLFTGKQLQEVFYSGLLARKNTIAREQMAQIVQIPQQLIHTHLKKPETSLIPTSKAKSTTTPNKLGNKSHTPSPSPSSLSICIPREVIMNNVCCYLDMHSVFKLSKTARALAMICHHPKAINNVQLLEAETEEEHYFGCIRDHHRFKCVKQLRMTFAGWESWTLVSNANAFFRCMHNVESLEVTDYRPDITVSFPKLKRLSLECTDYYDSEAFLDEFSAKSLSNGINHREMDHNLFYVPSVYNLEVLELHDECFYNEEDVRSPTLEHMFNLILPMSSTNRLRILKLINMMWSTDDVAESSTEVQQRLQDSNQTRLSLTKLRGFVSEAQKYNADSLISDTNAFYLFSCTILRSLHLQLQSIHIHGDYTDIHSYPCQYLLQPLTTLAKKTSNLRELCVDLNIQSPYNHIYERLSKNVVSLAQTSVEKLCLVFTNSKSLTTALKPGKYPIIKTLLQQQPSTLQHLHIAIRGRERDEKTELGYINAFLRALATSLLEISSHTTTLSRPLIFEISIPMIFSTSAAFAVQRRKYPIFAVIRDLLLMRYLMAMPNGMIQLNFTLGGCIAAQCKDIISTHIVRPLSKLFCVHHYQHGLTFTVTNKNQLFEYDRKWMCNCTICEYNK